MHLQAQGILDGRFVGADKELDLMVELFRLNVQIYDSSDSLPDDPDIGDLEYSECVSADTLFDSNTRQDIVLFRENVYEFSLLFKHPLKTASPAAALDSSVVKAPKFTMSYCGEFPGIKRPKVLSFPSPPRPSHCLFTVATAGAYLHF